MNGLEKLAKLVLSTPDEDVVDIEGMAELSDTEIDELAKIINSLKEEA